MNLILVLINLTTPSFADPTAPAPFHDYAVPAYSAPCKALDFSSYHKAERAKSNILHSKVDLTHANFAGKYILIRNDYLFETIFFVANCETGLFIKDTVDPDHKNPEVEFKPDSSLIMISSKDPKSNTPTEWQAFRGEKWMLIEIPKPVAIAASPAVTTNETPIVKKVTTGAANYADLYNEYPALKTVAQCKPLDFNSYHKAQKHQKHLIANTPDVSKPNYAGHYLLMRGEAIFQTWWLIADCETGQFLKQELTGQLGFNTNSRLAIIQRSGSYPLLRVWLDTENEWIKAHDPIQNESSEITNTIAGKRAKDFWLALVPNHKNNSVNFENLSCTGEQCKVDIGDQKMIQIQGQNFTIVSEIVKHWGRLNKTINSGRCTERNLSYQCELVI